MDRITNLLEQYKIFCLKNPSDDDLSNFYFIESQTFKGKYYRIVATAFGATSCSCVDQTKNSYQSCKHMKILDEILEKSPESIQAVRQIL
jgi:hypothetical protein